MLFFEDSHNDQYIKEHIIYTGQVTSESMPNGDYRPVEIMYGELALKLKCQQPHYKGNRLPIYNKTHRTEIIGKNVKDIVKRLYAVQ